MKKIQLPLLLLLLFTFVSAQTSITKEILCNTKWENHWEFKKNGFYCQLYSYSTGGAMALGRYEIRKGKLYLTDPVEAGEDDIFADTTNEYYARPFKAERTAQLIADKNAFRSSFYLVVEELHYESNPTIVPQIQSGISEGKLISIDNTVAITLADTSDYSVAAKTTSNLSLRATPSPTGKRLPWYTIEEINDTDNESVYKYHGLTFCKLSYLKKQTEDIRLTNLAYIPENTSIHAIARSYYKDTINGVADYWYYVDADNSLYTINGEGWVWGEFLKIKE